MSRKINGVTVGTPLNPQVIAEKTKSKAHMENKTIHVTAEEKQEWNDKLNTSDLPTKVSVFENDAGYLTEHQDLSDYATEEFVERSIANAQFGDDSEINLSDYYTKSETDKVIEEAVGAIEIPKVDLSNHYTKEETDTAITNAIDSIDIPETDLSEYPTRQEVQETYQPKGNYLTEIPDEYVKENDLEDYALKSELPSVPTKVSQLENDKGYLMEHQSLEEYAKKTELPTIPTKVSAFENDKGYLTEHQSLAGYATEAWVAEKGFLTEIDKEEIVTAVISALPVYNGEVGEA